MSKREDLRDAYAAMQDMSPEGKKKAPKVEVPLIARSARRPPRKFQVQLDKFNRSAGEKLFMHWNVKSVPRVSSTVNLDGHYSVEGWEGRWELWRPVNETMPFEVFAAIQPMVIDGVGPAVRLWRIQDDVKDIRLMHASGAEQVFQVGTARDPNEKDIKTLRLCDLYREGSGQVLKEIMDDPNAKKEADAESEFDDLADNLSSYYWSKAGGIYAVGDLPKDMTAQPKKILGG